jgi:hypothetical protein
VDVGADLTVPSAQLALPQESLSITVLETSDEQGTLERVVLNNPTFPLVPDILNPEVEVEKSGVTGRDDPTVPAAPHSMSKYFLAPTVVPAGKVKPLDAELVKLPVADSYEIDQPLISTGEQLLL